MTVDGEVIGWRGWNLDRDEQGPLLRSPQYGTAWRGPVLAADKKPRRWHAHGIYALAERGWGFFDWDVYGEVALLGRVLVGERGYRAERAVIRSLYLSQHVGFVTPSAGRALLREQLGSRYGVEVLDYETPASGPRPSVPSMMGVLRLLDPAGRVRDSAPWFGGPVKFSRSREAFTAAGTRLDLSGGSTVGWFPAPVTVMAGDFATVSLRVWGLRQA